MTVCSNCGADKPGEFCGSCGQNSRNYLKGAHRIVGDLIAETFELDSRLVRTLRYLVFSPGRLPTEFSLGRRARYASPVRLYLAISLLFFFVLSLDSVDFAIGEDGIELTFDLEDAAQDLEGLGLDDAAGDVRAAGPEASGEPSIAVPGAGPEAQALTQRLRQMAQNPARAYGEFVDKLPVTAFLLVPVFALLLKLVYRHRSYSEHFVFALHLHSFAFLAFSVLVLLPETGVVWAGLGDGLQLACLVYAYLALKRTYGQSALRTLLKGGLVLGVYLILVVAALLGAVFATVFLY